MGGCIMKKTERMTLQEGIFVTAIIEDEYSI